MTATDTTAKNATGTPPTLLSAGRVMITPMTDTNITALAGMLVLVLTRTASWTRGSRRPG